MSATTTQDRVSVISPPLPTPGNHKNLRRILKPLPPGSWDDPTAVTVDLSVPKPFDPVVIFKELIPEISNPLEMDFIIWNETGYPTFWNIPKDGKTPEECFRKQLLIAKVRRLIKYSNAKLDEDVYQGKLARIRAHSMVVETTNGSVIEIDSTGKPTIVRAEERVRRIDRIVYKDKPTERQWHPYVGVSDVMTEFLEQAKEKGLTQGEFMNLPMEVFINWLVLQAAKKDGDPNPELTIQHKVLQP